MDQLLARLSDDFDAQSTAEFMDGAKKSVGALFAHGREFSEQLLDNDPILEVADRMLLPAAPMAVGAAPLSEASLSSASDTIRRTAQPRIRSYVRIATIIGSTPASRCRSGRVATTSDFTATSGAICPSCGAIRRVRSSPSP